MERRTDYLTEIYIEAVINGLPSIGQRQAAIVLRELGVPVQIALRVLTRPDERRQVMAPLSAAMTSAPAAPGSHARLPSA